MTTRKTFGLTAIAITAVLAATVGSGSLAAAPMSASSAVTTRQANYKKMGAAMKVLKDQLAAASIDKAKAGAAAKTLAVTGRQQAALFPNGSGASSGVKTAALPAIWTNRAAFDGQMKAFIGQVDKLVAVTATGNIEAVGAQFKAVGGTCGSCHRQFRAES